MSPKSQSNMELSGSVWVQKAGQKVFAEERIALLEKIHELGSITHAAKAVGISYKTAWDTVNLMNNLADKPLVDRNTGGRGGGGTALTEAGLEVIRNFRIFSEEHRRFLENLGHRMEGGDNLYTFLRRLSMKVSARNTFAGTVSEITRGGVNAMVVLALKGGTSICATVTNASIDGLELSLGKQAYAIVKASAVVLGTDLDPSMVSARNILRGKVCKIIDGQVNTEVDLDLGEGNTISAVVTHESFIKMDLEVGSMACAIFKASSVIIGV
nr:TOBE domain-containing protein [uncultured Holophaga sp.]